MRRLTTTLVGALALAAIGCSDPDPVPTVTILEVTPDSLDPALDDSDDLQITVEYADGDGDLGEGIAEVHDCRSASLVNTFEIPALANPDAVEQGVPIEGRLLLTISDVGDITPDSTAPAVCSDLGVAAAAAGEAVFCVVLTDAAGNTSDGDCTPTIAIAPSS